MKAKDYIEEVLKIEVPETPVINGRWFAEKGLPMIVECVSCGMTMSLFSADIKKDGTTFCTSCAPTDEEYDKAFEDLEEDYEDLDSLGDMHSCDISGICSGSSCDLYYECNMKCKG